METRESYDNLNFKILSRMGAWYWCSTQTRAGELNQRYLFQHQLRFSQEYKNTCQKQQPVAT